MYKYIIGGDNHPMTTKDIDKDKIEKLISQLEINTDNIYHVMLSSKMEMIGELFHPQQVRISEGNDNNNNDEYGDSPELILEENDLFTFEEDNLDNDFTRDDPDDIIFLNPIRIMRDEWVDDEGNFHSKAFFVEWNSCIEGPYTHINKNKITAINSPNSETLLEYLKSVYNQYYPLLDELRHNGVVFKEATNLETIDSESIKKSPTNVISFSPYKKKRDVGTF